MRRIPARFAPLLFGGLLSAIMGMVVSAVVLLLNQGFSPTFFTAWFKSVVTVWPIAFPTVLIVAPLVRKLVACMTSTS